MSQELLIELKARDVSLSAAMEENIDLQRRYRAELKKTGDTGSDEYRQITDAIAKLKVAQRDIREEQKKVNKDLTLSNVPKDSVIGLRIEYQKLQQEIYRLSAAERQSKFGQTLVARAKDLHGQISDAEQSVGVFSRNVGNYKSAFSGISAVASKVTLGVGAVFAALNGGSELVDATRKFEKFGAVMRVAFEGNQYAADQAFERIKQFAATTPFQVDEIVESFIRLKTRGFTPTNEELAKMGDLAASQGKSFLQLTEAILDAQTGEYERLKEFGIKVKTEGDKLKVTFGTQTTTIDKTSAAIQEYILGLGELKSIQGSTVAVSKTLDGAISNFNDNMTRLEATLGSSGGFLQSIVQGFSDIVAQVTDFLEIPLSEKLRDQQSEFVALTTALQDTNLEESTRNGLIREIQSKYGEYIGNIDLETASQAELNAAIAEGNKLFERRIVVQAGREEEERLVRNLIELEKGLQSARVASANDYSQRGGGTDATGRPQIAVPTTGSELIQSTVDTYTQKILAARAELEAFRSGQADLIRQMFGTDEAFKQFLATEEKLSAGTAAATDKDKLRADTLAYLKKKISEVQQEIEKTPPGDPLRDKLQRLIGLQTELEQLEAAIKKIDDALRGTIQNFDPLETVGERLAKQRAAYEAELSAIGEIVTDLTEKNNQKAAKSLLENIKAFGQQAAASANDTAKAAASAQADTLGRAAEDFTAFLKDNRDELVGGVVDLAAQISAGIADIQTKRINDEETAQLASLDKTYNERLKLVQGNTAAEEKLAEEFERKKARVEKKAAEERKRIAINEALIQGALAVVKALPNLVLAAFAASATAVQVALMSKRQFAGGGFKDGKGKAPGFGLYSADFFNTLPQLKSGFTGSGIGVTDSTGHTVAGRLGNDAVVHAGEYIGDAGQVKRYPSLFAWLEKDRLRHARQYAAGGFNNAVIGGIPASPPGGQVVVVLPEEVMDKFGQRVGAQVGALAGAAVKSGVAAGLGDATDRLNREQFAKINSKI